MAIELVEVEPGRWRVKREQTPPARSGLPLPYIISDIMPPTEQVDGRFYTSKSEFRRIGKAHGLIEVGTEKPRLKTTRASQEKATKLARQRSIKKAVEMFNSGHRYRPNGQ
jgi:hypothetical protein